MPKKLQETARITEAAATAARETGRMPVQLISPGWGSSGYYSTEVLEAAVTADLFPAGTHMYADHPTAQEAKDRPVRSIKDLMSVTVEPGRIATDDDIAEWGADPGSVVTEIDVLPAYRDVVEHLRDAIGLSIRGDGELALGTAEGRNGKIVESLAHVQSVDWVTRAGRGGKVLSLVESASVVTGAAARAVAHGLEEATAEERREQLSNAVKETHGTDDRWAWVRDFDDDVVWFETHAEDEASKTWQQAYTVADDDLTVTLTGDRTEVRALTKYVPATRSDESTTTESKETPMGKINIEESEHTRLVEEAGRVAQLQEENATLKTELGTLKEADARRTRSERAVKLVEERAKEAGVTYTPLEVKGLCADLPLTEAGTLDEAKFTTSIDEDAAARKAAGGAGSITGHGGALPETGTSQVQESDFWTDIDNELGIGAGQKGA